MNRIDRLTAILIQLQSKRVVKAEEIADRFEISLRTVYRDVKALMEAGVPIGSEAGKGYFIVDGYHLPPVMFNQEEASAMMMAGKLIEKMSDVSIRKAFDSALLKIRSVLNDAEKDHLENLQSVVQVWRQPRTAEPDFPDHFLTDIQRAVVKKEVLEVEYFSSYNETLTKRGLEPIGLFYYSGGWHLIAWCRMRQDYRDFRADRIKTLRNTGMKFENNNIMSLQEYFKAMSRSNREVEEVVVLFDRSVVKFIGEQKYMYGFISQTDLGDKCSLTFYTAYLKALAHWLLTFGSATEIQKPEKLKSMMVELIEDLHSHYVTPVSSSINS
jgi:predicted DNA-binding transcriptional regulator YafY